MPAPFGTQMNNLTDRTFDCAATCRYTLFNLNRSDSSVNRSDLSVNRSDLSVNHSDLNVNRSDSN